jgi:pimeloyl-ACP methyl ester carboxylesterase
MEGLLRVLALPGLKSRTSAPLVRVPSPPGANGRRPSRAHLGYRGPMRTEFVTANGIRFHFKTEGGGPLVLLLHGFPEFWYEWRHLIPALAAHGYRVVAPDLRGYGETSRPTRIRGYRISILGDDVAALIGALGERKAHLIGHDWGGAVAWETAFAHPEVVDRLVVVNCPPAQALVRAWRTSLSQLRRSWYFFFFALPGLPERVLTRRHGEALTRFFEGANFSADDLEVYREAICRPGAAWAALAYYRAAARSVLSDRARLHGRKVASPTLVIWGEQDPALGKELTLGLDRYVRGPLRIEYLPDAGHWVVEQFPDRVAELVTGFLAEGAMPPA